MGKRVGPRGGPEHKRLVREIKKHLKEVYGVRDEDIKEPYTFCIAPKIRKKGRPEGYREIDLVVIPESSETPPKALSIECGIITEERLGHLLEMFDTVIWVPYCKGLRNITRTIDIVHRYDNSFVGGYDIKEQDISYFFFSKHEGFKEFKTDAG